MTLEPPLAAQHTRYHEVFYQAIAQRSLPYDAFHLVPCPLCQVAAAGISSNKVYLNFIEAHLLKQKCGECLEAAQHNTFAFVFRGYPVAYLSAIQLVIPMVQTEPAYQILIQKYPQRKTVLRFRLVMHIINELDGVFYLGGLLHPAQPR